MKKNFLLAASLLLLSVSASAQVEFRSADLMKLRQLTSVSTPEASKVKIRKEVGIDTRNRVAVIVRYDSQAALDEIRNKGGEVVNVVTRRHAIVLVDPAKAVDMVATKGISGAKLSELVKRANDKALPASNITAVHQGTGLPKGFDGEGVVVGVFDVGIDPNHINFRDASGQSRVRSFWLYEDAKVVPEVYDTPEKIARATTDATNDTHGTHVLGIMAGSFKDTSDPTAPDYRGIAPAAEIVAAAGPGYNAQILDGIKRCAIYAKQKGKPCVINLSFGDNVGPHDGTDEFTEAINDVAVEYGAVICLAGGNERERPLALVKTFTDDRPQVRTFLSKGEYAPSDATFQTYGSIEIWGEDKTPFQVFLDVVSRSKPDEPLYSFEIEGSKQSYVNQGDMLSQSGLDINKITTIDEGTEFHNIYSNSFMGGARGVDSYNKRYCCVVNTCLYARSSVNANKYKVLLRVKGQPGKKVYIYCDGYYMYFDNFYNPAIDKPDGYGTNSNMGSGPHTIAVGSYVTNNYAESGYREQTIGEPSYFSSYGESGDGRIMPHVCTPGQVIVSSRNMHYATTGSAATYYPLIYSYYDSSNKKTYYWTTCGGTSQASPHMAGVAALWLQANPNLTYTDIQNIAAQSAKMPSTGEGWGHGIVDAYAGIKLALGESGIYDILDNSPESILIEGDAKRGFNIYAPGQSQIVATVFDLSGNAVATAQTHGEELTLSLHNLPAGVYVLQVNGSHSTRSLKVTK